jgi:hypothetical protein
MNLPHANVSVCTFARNTERTWVTLDRDYARFPGLHWSLPSAN